MQAARTVTRLASRIQGVWPFRYQPGVIGRLKIPVNGVVARLAFLGADVFSARDIWQDHCPIHSAAGDDAKHKHERATD
jgi:hypothetical protein